MNYPFQVVAWHPGRVVLLDQRKLPSEEVYACLDNVEAVAQAIENMTVRGAPAIGVTAALGVALGVHHSKATEVGTLRAEVARISERLLQTRPTAVNLQWALHHLRTFIDHQSDLNVTDLKQKIIAEALAIRERDILTNQQLGLKGQALLPEQATVLTHCNAGALATAGYGTALGVIYAAVEKGKKIHVYVDETRPFLQGARLTSWELMKNGVPCTLITDNMAGWIMKTQTIDAIMVGADRIAANGDVANKIGTYSLAILAKEHEIPFYVAGPLSTIDLNTKTGESIPIEERSTQEVCKVMGRRIAPIDMPARHPAFDVTPSRYITAIITEQGIAQAPYEQALRELFALKH